MESDSEDKKLKIDGAGGIDRISDLPDPLLCKIISNLSTKNAAATKILSTRWKNLFPFGLSPVYLDFDDSETLRRSPSQLRLFERLRDSSLVHFRHFVDKLLHHTLVGFPCVVESMHLSCHKSYGIQNPHGINKIVSWVTAALQLKVQSLVLKLELDMDGTRTLSGSLNGCTTLLSLSVILDPIYRTVLCVPDNFSLPNLNKLHLSGVVFDDDDDRGDDSVNKILNGCPVLEDLSLNMCMFLMTGVIRIRSTLLKCLSIDSSQYTGGCFDIDAPNVERLMFRCFSTRKHRTSEFKSVRTAHLDTRKSTLTEGKREDMDIYYHEDDECSVNEGIAQLVSSCSNTISLHLARRSIHALSNRSVRLPEFYNLTWLRLGSLTYKGWALLARLLQNSPNLIKLVFGQEFMEKKFPEDKGGYADFQKHLVLHPPRCLKLHVKEIEFLVFNMKDDESKLLAYLLKNGKVLEKVLLRCLPSVINILTKFSTDPRIILEARVGKGLK